MSTNPKMEMKRSFVTAMSSFQMLRKVLLITLFPYGSLHQLILSFCQSKCLDNSITV
jgi:hypothetical protein